MGNGNQGMGCGSCQVWQQLDMDPGYTHGCWLDVCTACQLQRGHHGWSCARNRMLDGRCIQSPAAAGKVVAIGPRTCNGLSGRGSSTAGESGLDRAPVMFLRSEKRCMVAFWRSSASAVAALASCSSNRAWTWEDRGKGFQDHADANDSSTQPSLEACLFLCLFVWYG